MKFFSFLLWPLAWIFAAIVTMRNYFYDWGLLRIRQVSVPVIGVGNISTGGTGKTPWVHAIVEFLTNHDQKVSIVSRGYSGDFDGCLEVSPEMDPRRCGDEPLWLVQNTSASVVVGRNRWAASQLALKKSQSQIIVLDDGFQHRQLKRDLDVVLIDASAPMAHYHFLPTGRLREGFSALQRAHVVILNKCNFSSDKKRQYLADKIKKHVGVDRVFEADFSFSHWVDFNGKTITFDDSQNLAMTCGLGNPKAFLKTLNSLNLSVVKTFIFPDHHYWKPRDVEAMTYNLKREKLQYLAMTEKDAIKLSRYTKHFSEMKIAPLVCKMKIQINSKEQAFWKLVKEVMS